jgi:hypothetical protein
MLHALETIALATIIVANSSAFDKTYEKVSLAIAEKQVLPGR